MIPVVPQQKCILIVVRKQTMKEEGTTTVEKLTEAIKKP